MFPNHKQREAANNYAGYHYLMIDVRPTIRYVRRRTAM